LKSRPCRALFWGIATSRWTASAVTCRVASTRWWRQPT
jgi:hypothetical protein